MFQRLMSLASLGVLLLSGTQVAGGQLPGHHWELLAVAYPLDRDVEVTLGGAERTLTSRGICKVKSQEGSATMEINLENLPPPGEIGWAGRQYVLWAVDAEKRKVNLGAVPLQQEKAKWKLQVPFRVFGLLVTAEENTQAEAPSGAVVLESLLPINPKLVVPVFRVDVELVPLEG